MKETITGEGIGRRTCELYGMEAVEWGRRTGGESGEVELRDDGEEIGDVR